MLGFLEGGGVEVPILFLWAWGFFPSQGVALKGLRAIEQLEVAEVLQKPVFALAGRQQISVNTVLCRTLGLAD